MHALSRSLVTAGALAAFSIGAAPAAFAQQACDDYSGGCADVGGVVQAPAEGAPAGQGAGAGTVVSNRVTPAATPTTLPFTGGEVVLLAATGVGALAVGALAVRAGRRRVSPAA